MKKFAMLMLCLVLVFALAACAGTDTTPQGSVSDTVTVTDMKGEVAIPANPQRIVDVAGLTEELLILDMKVIASANTSMFDGVSVPKHLTTLFAERGIEVVGNYSGSSSTGDLNLEKIAELKPDLIIMNIRHEKVYEQLAAIAPTVMIDDDISYVNWRGRFQQLGQWFDKEAAVEKWLADYDAKAAELAARIRDMIGDETFAVLEANSVHFGSYYIYRSGGPGELVYDELKLTPSAGVPENVWGEVVDAEYFSLIDADHIFFFSDDGRAGDTGNLAGGAVLLAALDQQPEQRQQRRNDDQIQRGQHLGAPELEEGRNAQNGLYDQQNSTSFRVGRAGICIRPAAGGL